MAVGIYNCGKGRDYNKPRLFFNWIGCHWEAKRYLRLTYESARFIYSNEGWKVTISFHPRVFYFYKNSMEFRVAFFGLGIHYRR